MARKLASFTLDEDTIVILNRYSEEHNINKSKCVEMLINNHLSENKSDNISGMTLEDIAEKVAEILSKK